MEKEELVKLKENLRKMREDQVRRILGHVMSQDAEERKSFSAYQKEWQLVGEYLENATRLLEQEWEHPAQTEFEKKQQEKKFQCLQELCEQLSSVQDQLDTMGELKQLSEQTLLFSFLDFYTTKKEQLLAEASYEEQIESLYEKMVQWKQIEEETQNEKKTDPKRRK